MTTGALTRVGSTSNPSPVGRLFIQPTVATRGAPSIRLDDALGPWFALVAWNNDPRAILDDDALARLARNNVRLVTARPAVQLHWDEGDADDSILVVGDLDGSLKRWFDARSESVLLLRPDRIVAGGSPAYGASDMVRNFDRAIGAPDPTTKAASPARSAQLPHLRPASDAGVTRRSRAREDA
jgi:3-(3-hydroxy-phenyl)propionate hydroxylase